jgi:hypothetical protein
VNELLDRERKRRRRHETLDLMARFAIALALIIYIGLMADKVVELAEHIADLLFGR